MTRDASKIIFDATDFNYPKIAVSDSVTTNVPSFAGVYTEVTVNHNLGYIPTGRVWFDPNLGKKFIAGNSLYQDSGGADYTNGIVTSYMYFTTSTLVIGYANLTASTVNVTTIYRIYYDS